MHGKAIIFYVQGVLFGCFLLSHMQINAMASDRQDIFSVSKSLFSKTISKFFSPAELPAVEAWQVPEVVWQKAGTDPFNELIVSWNALRPKNGYMTVWVSVKLREWTAWHRLAQWGQDYQRTFVNKLNPYVHTKHCRVEMQRGALGRGFRIRVTFHQGANPKNLKACFACMSRLKDFKLMYPRIKLPSVAIKGFPRQSQLVINHERCKDLCSPVSTSMMVAYFYQRFYGMKPDNPMQNYVIDFAEKSHDQGYLDIYGNWILNVAQAFDSCNGDVFFRVERLNSFYDLYHCLAQKIPVAVSVRRLIGGATPYRKGHILVVVGWNRQKKCVICMDPAFKTTKQTLRAYPLRRFLRAWARSNNLSYVPLLPE